MVGNLLHGGRVGKGVVGVAAIGHAMVPASTDVAAVPEAAIITGSCPLPDQTSRPGPSIGGTGIETA